MKNPPHIDALRALAQCVFELSRVLGSTGVMHPIDCSLFVCKILLEAVAQPISAAVQLQPEVEKMRNAAIAALRAMMAELGSVIHQAPPGMSVPRNG